MVTMGVAPSDSGEEEGREMKNKAVTPPLFCFCFFPVYFSSALPPLSERLEKVRIECLVSEYYCL